MKPIVTEDKLGIVQRFRLPTPVFFKKLRLVGLMLTAISVALVALPAGFPAFVAQVAGYCAVAGTVITVVSQATVSEDALWDMRGTPMGANPVQRLLHE